MDRVEELAHVRRQAAAENIIIVRKFFFGSKGFSKKGADEIRRSPWRGCSQSLVLPTSPSEGKSEARRRAWRLRLHLDEAIGSRAEDGG